MPDPIELSNVYSEKAYAYLNQKKYNQSLEYLRLAYKNDAKPILSFKMAQLYDYYLDNKKMAIDCYEGYITMTNVADNFDELNNSTELFVVNLDVVENAKERIRILQEKLFFESANKE